MNQSRVRRLETAGIEVERSEVFVEVNVQPVAARFLGVDGGSSNQLGSGAGMLVDGAHLGIEQEVMVAAVPFNVHEANEQSVVVPGTHPTKAVRANPGPPTARRAPAVRLRERDQLLVRKFAAPLVLETHVPIVADGDGARLDAVVRNFCAVSSTLRRDGA